MAAAACDLSRGNFFLCVFISVCFSAGLIVSEEDLGSPLRTAQCRAGCVNKVAVLYKYFFSLVSFFSTSLSAVFVLYLLLVTRSFAGS